MDNQTATTANLIPSRTLTTAYYSFQPTIKVFVILIRINFSKISGVKMAKNKKSIGFKITNVPFRMG
jgi:hypothetical protein